MTGVWPPPVTYGEPLPLFDSDRGADSSPRDTYGLGGRPSLREPCRPSAAGWQLVCLVHGKVIFAGSTLRREKMRLDPCTGTSITAQSRCSSRSLPPLMAHKRPAQLWQRLTCPAVRAADRRRGMAGLFRRFHFWAMPRASLGCIIRWSVAAAARPGEE